MDKHGSKIMQQTKPRHLWGFALPSRILPTPREPIAWRNTFIDPFLPQSACVKCPSKLSRNCWTKSSFFFFFKNYKFWSINSFVNYFLKEPGNLDTKFRAGPSPNYVGEVLDFFISNSEKALNTRLFWGTGEDGTGKCPFQQNSCYQETSSTTNWKPSATHRLLHSLIL